jgi:hypothetical protein
LNDQSVAIAHHMNKNNNYRRSLIKRSLTLIGGIFFFGALRSNFGAVAKASAPNPNGHMARKARGRTQQCIEGVSLGSPV